jgi:hypothetical protein
MLYASPTLTEADAPNYFKDATFGVKPEDVESTGHPRPGVTIVRDQQYDVPHIYGTPPRTSSSARGTPVPRTAWSS